MMLPDPKGPHRVGLATFSHPVERERFGISKLPNGDDALVMEEIAYNVFYPASVSKTSRKGVHWLVRPLNDVVAGFAKFAGLTSVLVWPFVYLYAKFIKIPAFADARVLAPSDAPVPSTSEKSSDISSDTVSAKKWKLAVFSHGLAGSRTTYSRFCSRLASEGYVVLALEHRDGTAPTVRLRTSDSGSEKGKETWRTLIYSKHEEIVWGDDKPEVNALGGFPTPFRSEQLLFRLREIYEAVQSFSRLVETGEKGPLRCDTQGSSVDPSTYDWSQWHDVVDTSSLSLTSHSFGAATALTVLQQPPPAPFPPLDISHVILLDPWVDPVAAPGPAPSTDRPRPPLVVMNSERFTLWDDHFQRLRGIARGWKKRDEHGKEVDGATLLTLVQARHDDYSDFPSIVPFSTRRADILNNTIQTLSMAFLRDSLDVELSKESRRDTVVEERKGKKVLAGSFGEVLVHAVS